MVATNIEFFFLPSFVNFFSNELHVIVTKRFTSQGLLHCLLLLLLWQPNFESFESYIVPSNTVSRKEKEKEFADAIQ